MTLAGSLLLRPGTAEGALRSTRRDWAPVVGRGRLADELPSLLAAVFSLCGDAHRLTAQAAVAAARGRPGPFEAGLPRALRQETLAEHLRRWWLDAPRLLPDDEDAAAARLAYCPALQPAGGAADHDHDAAVRSWIEREVLGATAAGWLDAWSRHPLTCATAWADAGRTWPARWTRAARQALDGCRVPVHALPALTAPAAATLGDALVRARGFVGAPTWHGRPAETGPWTRAADAASTDPTACALLWMRAAARAADVARLVAVPLHDTPPPLDCGARALGPRTGLAWCEMARGVLIHRVELDADDRVRDCRVLAPTDWNAHPLGGLAQALADCPTDATESTLRWMAAVFDPCVECRIDHPTPETDRA